MQISKLKIEYKSVKKLIPYANNARVHSDEQVSEIMASMREFGFTAPILINDKSEILAGHGRLMAAFRLEMKEVPTIELSQLTKAQQKAYILADNKLALNASWDDALLKLELTGLREMDFDLSIIGFSVSEIDDIFADLLDGGLTDPDDVPKPNAKAITEPGDVWELGDHRVRCGDSTSEYEVSLLMSGNLADLFITDPPYNIEYVGKTKEAKTIKNDSMKDDKFSKFLTQAFSSANAVMKEGAVFYIWHAGTEAYNFLAGCRNVNWAIRQCLIWNKNTMVMGRQDYQWKHEHCLYGWKEGAGHLWATDRRQVTVLDFDRPTKSTDHPTMKPVNLFEYQITNNTKGSDVVLDLFGGSGTTLIACEKSGRICRMMELDPIYVDVIIRRWQAYTGKKAVTLAGKTIDNEVIYDDKEKAIA